MIDSEDLALYQPVLLADDQDRFLRGAVVVHGCVTGDWMQYWIAYPADRDHAGTDWEMVMFSRPDPTAPPTHAVYARHRGAGWRPWERVRKRGDRPLVYVSRDKHASYFAAGWHRHGLHLERCNGRRELTGLLRIGVPPQVARRLAHTDPDVWAASKLAW